MSAKERAVSKRRVKGVTETKTKEKAKTKKRVKRSSSVAKKTTKKVTKTTTTKAKTKTVKKTVENTKAKGKLTLATTQGLMILSPFRFPLDVDKLAIQTARFGGVFFVIMGGIFTLFHANAVFSMLSSDHLAATTVSTSLNDGTATVSSDLANSINTDPQVVIYDDYTSDFRFELYEPIRSANERVRISPEGDPQEIWLQTENIDTGEVIKLGAFKKVTGSSWELVFDTTILEDGDYQFQAVARYLDQHNSSYNVFITDRQIRNVYNFEPSFQSHFLSYGRNLSGVEQATIKADLPEEVQVSLNDSSGKTVDTYGRAKQRDDQTWVISFDTTRHPNGNYKLYAELVWPYHEEFITQEITINNVTTATTNTSTTDNTNTTVETTTTDDATEVDDTTTVSDIVETVDEQIDKYTDPNIEIIVDSSKPLSGTVNVGVRVALADFIELYVQPKSSANQRYLGLARKVDTTLWRYALNSKNLPNGEYRIFAKVKNKYGIFSEDSDWVRVYNETITISEQEDIKYQEDAVRVASETTVQTTVLYPTNISSSDSGSSLQTNQVSPEQQLDDLIAAQAEETDSTPDEVSEGYNQLVQVYKAELEEALQALAVAYRSTDQNQIDQANNRINRIVADITQSAIRASVKEDIIRHTDERIQYLVNRIKSDVDRTNEIIQKRTGKDASQDSDGDGITDFDEVTIYRTDPRVADSDSDGFVDGVEVLNGYDPTDSTPEVAVAFESPQDVGVVREDLLAVYTIATEDFNAGKEISDNTTTSTNAAKKSPVAVITGKALPNSFATLFVFSTPIVVTVRTESDGSWMYRFDKELEDGNHQVYVGITDNAGKIVAKSRPLSFTKQAEAYTQVDEPLVPGAVVGSTGNIFDQISPMMLLIASLSVVSIGLVLILLGWHLENRNRLSIVSDTPDPVFT